MTCSILWLAVIGCESEGEPFDPTEDGGGRFVPTRGDEAATFTTADPGEQPPETFGNTAGPVSTSGATFGTSATDTDGASETGEPDPTTGVSPPGAYAACPCAPTEQCIIPGEAVGTFCAPPCPSGDSLECPSAPDGTANSECILGDAGPIWCALLCNVGGTDCPVGMTCESVSGVGVCTWL